LSRFYRVLRAAYADAPFDGEGAFRYGGRWSSPGVRLSYASEHQSLAMLEYFVHVDQEDSPEDLVLAIAEVPDDLSRERVRASDLPANWRESPAPAGLARVGDDFARKGEHCLMLIPSVLAPEENNCVINPAHPGFARVRVRKPEPLHYDPRLFGRRASARRQRNRRSR